MKIQNVIPLISSRVFNYETSYSDDWGRHRFRPDDYSGIDAIYLEFVAYASDADTEGEIELYDFATSTEISGSQTGIIGTTPTRYRTADLKSVLTTAMDLGTRSKVTAGDGIIYASQPRLIIRQTATGVTRKTALHLVQAADFSVLAESFINATPAIYFKPPLNDIDGTKSVKAVVYLRASGGGNAYCRLYDVTAAAAVSGCEFQTTALSLTRFESEELTLDPTHEYVWQAHSWNAMATCNIAGAEIRITTTGFSKTVAWPFVTSTVYYATGAGYQKVKDFMLFEVAYFDGADGLTYKLLHCLDITKYQAWNEAVRLYDNTDVAAIAGTTHSESGTGQTIYRYEDTPTLPSGSHELQPELDSDVDDEQYAPQIIVAFQIENLPEEPSLPPNPDQPSGYHCFMNQFLRNMFGGYVPYLTPDGYNKCW